MCSLDTGPLGIDVDLMQNRDPRAEWYLSPCGAGVESELDLGI